jgi:hypothetical protein
MNTATSRVENLAKVSAVDVAVRLSVCGEQLGDP